MAETPFLEVKNLYKSYDNGLVTALRGISFQLQRGKIYALMGSSGCGKSTLLNLIGTLDKPQSGTILYEGKEITAFHSPSQFRREYLGFVFQFHHLIPVLTLRENVETAMLSNRTLNSKQRQEKAIQLLHDMGLKGKEESKATKISGGERQRVAIARALANNPKLILADEPTGNVDTKTSAMILQKLRTYVNNYKSTILIATHDPQVGALADTIISMQDGKIITIQHNDSFPSAT
jgi:putative ABC transport system ATP-binding protein